MEIAIVGLPLVGKTSLFDALTAGHSAAAPRGSSQEPQRAMVRVTDPRLAALADAFEPPKVTQATVGYVDTGAITGGAFESGQVTPGLLAALRSVDAFAHVVRAFASDRVPHVHDTIDLPRDAQDLDDEFALADLQIVEARQDRVARELRVRKDPVLNAEAAVLTRCREALEAGTPLRALEFSAAEDKAIRGFQFLTLKPLMLVVNIGEGQIGDDGVAEPLAAWNGAPQTRVVSLCVELEMELAQLPPDDAATFRADMELEGEAAMDRLVHESHRVLGLTTFYTAGENEVRAWTTGAGSTAVQAAGAIHTDLARGFIRAETAGWDELSTLGGYARAREAGKLRLEGKEYVVQDGDVLLIRFNV
ncbi:redox-regulated ATPase YchF [Candidatus Poribacteria bacterium]|nr:redox-regulated ATPase YchF [Candidatus Poribacteria bacterium]MBT5535208.1 redox-regulated ATPase YchF [Candidatus Poribacteria bacterium]MBT5712276.1 redox-regulated ATPase YchF [Candidatus Poribacteria bacterium]MBT7100882.1 redox-regulated ATPase YchF [Candidatus Poribacteria bacterium]MBT7804575.1 redox-regulated ATPase YchF [Candidatus Poribacteria bacterium]